MNSEEKGEMLAVSATICKKETTLADLRIKLRNIELEMKQRELLFYVDVTNEKTPDGKAVYTNEKLREAEISQRLVDVDKYVENKEEFELLAIEAGAEDINWQDNTLDIYTKPEDLERVKKELEDKKISIESAELGLVPKNTVTVDEKASPAPVRS